MVKNSLQTRSIVSFIGVKLNAGKAALILLLSQGRFLLVVAKVSRVSVGARPVKKLFIPSARQANCSSNGVRGRFEGFLP